MTSSSEQATSFTTRPTLRGYGGAVAASHHLAAHVGARALDDGGNAADAACAMGFALQVLEPTQCGPGGEAVILVHHAAEDRTWAISGQGSAPAALTLATLAGLGVDSIPPDGFLAATVPAATDAWCRLLERFGTRRLEDVIAPARDLAARGFPMYGYLDLVLRWVEPRFREYWPSSAAIYSPLPEIGGRLVNPDLAEFYDSLVRAERAAPGGREAGIRAARDHFYAGPAAERIEAFLAEPVLDASGEAHAGLLSAHDLAGYQGSVEEAVAADYRGARVWKCPPWSQGPVFLQQLRLLEGFDLRAMGRGSADALHTWIEAAKLAYADRDACYADPRFAEVPLDTLLSDGYTVSRRDLIDPERASLELRPGLGRLAAGWPPETPPADAEAPPSDGPAPAEPHALAASLGRGDTTQLAAADAAGNVVSASPSGGWVMTSPVVPGLGFPLGTRAQMFALDAGHPNALAPGKRPRTTLTPSLARLPDGRCVGFGTPGGDSQDQWTLQFFLDLVDFEVAELQAAIDAPTLTTLHMPSSFYPHHAQPGAVAAEDRVDPAVRDALAARGHRLQMSGGWQHGRVAAASHDPSSGCFEAAASPRFQVAYAVVLP